MARPLAAQEVPAASDPAVINLGATGVNDTLSCPKDAVGHRRGAQTRGCTGGAWASVRSRAMDETWRNVLTHRLHFEHTEPRLLRCVGPQGGHQGRTAFLGPKTGANDDQIPGSLAVTPFVAHGQGPPEEAPVTASGLLMEISRQVPTRTAQCPPHGSRCTDSLLLLPLGHERTEPSPVLRSPLSPETFRWSLSMSAQSAATNPTAQGWKNRCF